MFISLNKKTDVEVKGKVFFATVIVIEKKQIWAYGPVIAGATFVKTVGSLRYLVESCIVGGIVANIQGSTIATVNDLLTGEEPFQV